MLHYFIDENLQGRRFVDPLRESGLTITTAGDRGLRGVPDAEWIPRIAAEGLVIVTADRNIRLVPAEKAAVLNARARVIGLRVGGNKTLERLARNLLNSQRALESYDRSHPAPWFVVLSMPSPQHFERNRSGKIRTVDL